jgi:hypothetical protein
VNLSNKIIDNIVVLRDDYHIFSKMRATTSKGHEVSNVMAFRRRDAMKFIIKEYLAIKKLVVVADVDLPHIAPK